MRQCQSRVLLPLVLDSSPLTCLRVTETFILVLPANTEIGENSRWKEIRFEASQHPRLADDMTPSERVPEPAYM
jgi:hypothetical protein